jgi:serine/threonine protein kinase
MKDQIVISVPGAELQALFPKLSPKKTYRVFVSDQLLGEGGFANVYKAYLVDPKTGKPDASKMMACKTFKRKRKGVKTSFKTRLEFAKGEAEAEANKGLLQTSSPIKAHGRVYLLEKYLGSENLEDYLHGEEARLFKVDPETGDCWDYGIQLTLLQRVQIACRLSQELLQLHLGGNVHRDLGLKNTVVDSKVKAADVAPRLIDFAYKMGLEDSKDLKSLFPAQPGGSLPYMAPETSKGQIAFNSDVWALLPMLLKLFDVDDPFETRCEAQEDNVFWSRVVQLPYDRDELFLRLGYDLSKISVECDELLISLFDRMGKKDNQERLDSREVFHFFETLQELLLKLENNADLEEGEILALVAKMVLIVNGLYYEEITIFEGAVTLGELDLSQDSSLCDLLVDAYAEKEEMNEAFVWKLQKEITSSSEKVSAALVARFVRRGLGDSSPSDSGRSTPYGGISEIGSPLPEESRKDDLLIAGPAWN